MKKTITGWMPKSSMRKYEDGRHYFEFNEENEWGSEAISITLTYDAGKPNTKTVWEWMVKSDHRNGWTIFFDLLTEQEAACVFAHKPHKKLREFEVECD